MFNRTAATAAFALMLTSMISLPISGQSAPQKADKAASRVEKPAKSDDLLAGPKVEDSQPRRDRRRMMDDRPQEDRDEAAGRRWTAAMKEIELNPAQRKEIQSIVEEFKAARQKFNAEHRERRRELVAKMRRDLEAGIQPTPEFRRQMQELQKAAPKMEDFQQRVWKKLSSDQQASMRRKLDEMEKREVQERAKRESTGKKMKDGERPRQRGSMDDIDRPRKRPEDSRPTPSQSTKDRPGKPEHPSQGTSNKPRGKD